MSGDKRSVATDALEVLGMVITDKKVGRDAVHLACFPAKTFDSLTGPGAHVGLLEDGRISVFAAKPIGIVDPFLPGLVVAGQEVLVLVYPRTIESLRHVWSHPDIPEENTSVLVQTGVSMPPLKAPTVEDLIGRLDFVGRQLEWPLTGKQLFEHMDGEPYHVVYGDDASGEIKIPGDCWDMYTVIFGMPAANDPREPGNNGLYFSCSC